MKRVALTFLVAQFFLGCANEGPTSDEVGQQFQRGIHGEGQVTEDVDRSDDPYVKPRGGGGAVPEPTR